MSTFYGRVGNTIPEGITKLKAEVRRRMEAACREAGELIADSAYDKANVSPGEQGNAVDGTHMRDNIQVHVIKKPTMIEARIGVDMANVPYAHHQEFGPNGKPFLRPALDESRAEVHEILRDAMDGTGRSFVRYNRGRKPTTEE